MEKLSEHPPENEENDDSEPEVETKDDAKKKQRNTIWKKLIASLVIVPVIGFICVFFEINYKSVTSFFHRGTPSTEEGTLAKDTLVEETFFSTLESISAVRNDGGTVNPPDEANFIEGGCGKGFISRDSKEVITFPITEKNLKNLEAGSVELCVTLTKDLAEATDEYFLFMAYERDYDAIFLQLIDKDLPEYPTRRVARMRIKRGRNLDPKWVNAESEKLDWKAGEHYHLAGTWGKEGVKLYIDGKLVAHNPIVPAQPTQHPDSFTINNDSADTGNNPTHCIVRNLRISSYQKSDTEMKRSYESLHSGK